MLARNRDSRLGGIEFIKGDARQVGLRGGEKNGRPEGGEGAFLDLAVGREGLALKGVAARKLLQPVQGNTDHVDLFIEAVRLRHIRIIQCQTGLLGRVGVELHLAVIDAGLEGADKLVE